MDREIRNQQEAEYEETLRRDQEREERAREQAERERREQEERETLRRAELEKKDKIVRLKIELANKIPEEPEASGEDVVRILIKLPGGQRLERRSVSDGVTLSDLTFSMFRFLLSHSLEHIYYFVFCHPDSPDEFDIVTNYPRRTLQCKVKLRDPSHLSSLADLFLTAKLRSTITTYIERSGLRQGRNVVRIRLRVVNSKSSYFHMFYVNKFPSAFKRTIFMVVFFQRLSCFQMT